MIIFVGFRYQIRAIQGASVDPVTQLKNNDEPKPKPENWKIKMLYDGDCPLCMREVFILIRISLFLKLFITKLETTLLKLNCSVSVFLSKKVNMLKERNEETGTIKFVDISSNDYSPQENQGLDYKTVKLIYLTFSSLYHPLFRI